MADTNAPTWKFWHPLATWKMLLIMAIGQVVGQFGFGMILSPLGMSGDTAATVGAGLGGTLSYLVVMLLARRQKGEAGDPPEAPTS